MTGPAQSSNSKAFISAPIGVNVTYLSEILRRKGIDVLDFRSELASGEIWLHVVTKLINRADIVFAVLGDDANNNVMFELGLAASQDKKIVIIGQKLAPSYLSNFVHLTADLGDKRALDFQLDALLKNLDQVETTLFHEDIKPSNRPSPGRRQKTLNPHATTHSMAQQRLYEVLEASSEIDAVVIEPLLDNTVGFRPDFAIRFSKDAGYLTGPVAIELKVSNQGIIRKEWIHQITSYTIKLRSGFGLLVLDSPKQNKLRVANASPLVFTIGLAELEELLRHNNGAQELRRVRNSFMHSAGDHA